MLRSEVIQTPKRCIFIVTSSEWNFKSRVFTKLRVESMLSVLTGRVSQWQTRQRCISLIVCYDSGCWMSMDTVTHSLTLAKYQAETSTAKVLVSCSDMNFDKDLRWISKYLVSNLFKAYFQLYDTWMEHIVMICPRKFPYFWTHGMYRGQTYWVH